MKNRKTIHGSLFRAAVLAAACLTAAACTMVLTNEVKGTSAGSGGVLDPMLSIFEAELNASYSAARSLAPASRGLAGGANSILHGLPSTTVAKVKERVRGVIAASGLEKSRDIAKVAPAISEATAVALKDPTVVGTLAETDLVQVNAVSTKALAKSLTAASVAAVAEGLGTEGEKTARLEALTRASTGNVNGFGLTAANAADALQKLVLVVVESGNADVSASGATAPETILTARMSAVMKIAAARLDDSALFTGATCSAALNALANAAVVGLGGTAISGVADTGLQGVVQDGVLAGLFLAYYGFAQNVGVSASDLRSAITFSEAMTALGSGAYYDSVSLNVQAARATIVPAADAKARKSVIITSTTPPAIDIDTALDAATVAVGATTTWESGSAIHVPSSVTINGSLVIGSGVTVYLASGVSITVASTGSIQAQGTALSPINFTRATSGSAWGSIRINSNSSLNSLAYCDISGAAIGVEIAYSGSDLGIATIANCLFHGNASNGLEAADAKSDLGRVTTVRSCYFYGNSSYPAELNENVDFDASNHFYDPAGTAPATPSGSFNAASFSGDFSRSATLPALEVPYFISDDLDVNAPAVLTIKAGAVLKFAAGMDISVWSGAGLIAGEAGADKAKTIFTSYRDASIGGDTMGQGNLAAPGDWLYIDLMSSGNSFTNCEFRYATRGIDFNQWTTGQGSGSFDACVFKYNSSRGFEGSEAMAGTTVTNCAFFGNASFPVELNDAVAFAASNVFHDPALPAPASPAGTSNAIYWSGDVSSSTTLEISEVPYYVPSTLNVNSSARLTVNPGAIIKFAPGTITTYVYSGGSIVAGEIGQAKVIFTSYRDGSVGGDTSGLGSSAIAGDWVRIDLRTSGNSFANCEFRYATCAIDFNNSASEQGAGTFDTCVFRDCSSRGFEGSEARAGTTVANCAFYDNDSYPVELNDLIAFADSNVFHDPSLSAPATPLGSYNAIYWYGDVSVNTSFGISEVPYFIPDIFYVVSGAHLTIKPGAVIKFAAGTITMSIWSAGWITAGESGKAKVYFTSYRDGSIGGDTSGQGNTAAPGDWRRIDIRSPGNSFTNCEFRYAVCPIDFNDAGNEQGAGAIAGSSFIHNSAGGIDASEALAGTTLTGNVFSDNGANGTSIWDIDTGASGNVNVTTSGNTTTYTRPAGLQ